MASLGYADRYSIKNKIQHVSQNNDKFTRSSFQQRFEEELCELSNQSKVLEPDEAPQVLLSITIDLGEDQDTILVFENDDPQMLAELFGIKHNLDQEEIALVLQNIKQNMDLVLGNSQQQVLPTSLTQQQPEKTPKKKSFFKKNNANYQNILPKNLNELYEQTRNKQSNTNGLYKNIDQHQDKNSQPFRSPIQILNYNEINQPFETDYINPNQLSEQDKSDFNQPSPPSEHPNQSQFAQQQEKIGTYKRSLDYIKENCQDLMQTLSRNATDQDIEQEMNEPAKVKKKKAPKQPKQPK